MGTKSGEVDRVGTAVSAVGGVENPPVDAFDTSNPRSMLGLMPARWVQGFLDANSTHPELFEMTERELYNELRRIERKPDVVLNTIRMKLWSEYERCQATGAKGIEVFKVLGEVCRPTNFEKFILSVPERAAWLLCPPTSYSMKVEEALSFGIDKLRHILDQDVVTEKVDKLGNKSMVVNVKLGELMAKIVNMLDVRVHGAARVRIDQTNRSYSVSLNHNSSSVAAAVEGLTAEQLEEQIKKLENRESRALNLPPVHPEIEVNADIRAEFDRIDEEKVDGGNSGAADLVLGDVGGPYIPVGG